MIAVPPLECVARNPMYPPVGVYVVSVALPWLLVVDVVGSFALLTPPATAPGIAEV